MDSGELLRFYVKANKSQGGKPLYRLIVENARAMGMAGASVFGLSSRWAIMARFMMPVASIPRTSCPLSSRSWTSPRGSRRSSPSWARWRPRLRPHSSRLKSSVTLLMRSGKAPAMSLREQARHNTSSGGFEDPSTIGNDHAASWPREATHHLHWQLRHVARLQSGVSPSWRDAGQRKSPARRSAGASWASASSRESTRRGLGLSDDLPERIEIIDSPARSRSFCLFSKPWSTVA